MAMSKNQKHVVAASWDGSLRIFDFKTQKQIYSFEYPQRKSCSILCVACSPTEEIAIIGSVDRSITIFNTATKKEVHHFQNIHQGKVNWRNLTLTQQKKIV